MDKVTLSEFMSDFSADSLRDDLMNYIENSSFINGPEYIRKNKLIASLYLEKKDDLNAIYHSTEAHAASLRQKAIISCSEKNPHEEQFSGTLLFELNSNLLQFDGIYSKKGYDGVLARLEEMPEEWTIVQLTFGPNYDEPIFGFPRKCAPNMVDLLLTRLPCGKRKQKSPVIINIPPPYDGHNDGMSSILEIVNESIKKITLPGDPKQKKKNREEASNDLKNIISEEVSSSWIKEWRCIMIGTVRDCSLQDLFNYTVDNICQTVKEKTSFQFSEKGLSVLHQIVDACAHLSDSEIVNAIIYCIGENDDYVNISKICFGIVREFKEKYCAKLFKTKRNPVLLILDDALEKIPWELLPLLFTHPVSRIPSLHFAHALYDKHRDHIINGNRIVSDRDSAFYIVNPEKNLRQTEEKLMKFVQLRHPNWKGIKGDIPSRDDIIKILVDYNILMYSGHGSGSQYFHVEDVASLNINTVPFLFGCSSVAKQSYGNGGIYELYSESYNYLIAGCPCVIGMLWAVTSHDVDLITMTLINMTMSGDPVDINEVIEPCHIHPDNLYKEPELLRALKPARSVARRYTNGAALVAHGIPVEFRDSVVSS